MMKTKYIKIKFKKMTTYIEHQINFSNQHYAFKTYITEHIQRSCSIPWQNGPDQLLKHPLVHFPELGSQLVLFRQFELLQVELHPEPKYPESQTVKKLDIDYIYVTDFCKLGFVLITLINLGNSRF